MPKLFAFMPLALHWKGAGDRTSSTLKEAYCLLDLPKDATGLLRAVHDGTLRRPMVDGAERVRVVARTDANGVLVAVPASAGGAPEPSELSNCKPILFPLGSELSLWWTHDKEIFDEVRKQADEDRAHVAHDQMAHVTLAFDEGVGIPQAVVEVLVDTHAPMEASGWISRRSEASFPRELLQLADDKKTWCVVLRDHALELSVELALTIKEVARLPLENKVSAHQLLLTRVIDILKKRGKEHGFLKETIAMHERLGGAEYRAMLQDFEYAILGCAREIEHAGKGLSKIYRQALHELSVHPYEEGTFEERNSARFTQRWSAKLIIDAQGLYLRRAIIDTLYNHSDPKLTERLLQIARGEGDPENLNDTEQLLASCKAAADWLSKAEKYVGAVAKVGKEVTDPKVVRPLTDWIEFTITLAGAHADYHRMERKLAEEALTRTLHIVQALEGEAPSYSALWTSTSLKAVDDLSGVESILRTTKAIASGPTSRTFERVNTLLKVLNAASLTQGFFKDEDGKPSVLQQMIDLHGTLEGIEGTYRMITKASETELGTTLKSLGKVLAPLALYLSAEKTWSHLQAGNALAGLLETAGVGLGIITLTLELTKTAPHPALKVLLVTLGVAAAVGAEYSYDKDEEFLQQYRPSCRETGAYMRAKDAVRRIERSLKGTERDIDVLASRALKVAS